MPFFKMPTIRHIWQLIQHDDYAFSINLQDAYFNIPIDRHHHCSLQFVWHICHMSGRFYLLAGHSPNIFTALTKPDPFLCHHESFHIVINLDDVLVLVCSKWAGNRACSFLCSLLVWLGLYPIFSKPDLCLTQTFCFLGLCCDTVQKSVFLHPDKFSWHSAVSSCLVPDPTCYSLSSHVIFRQGHFLCQWTLLTAEILSCHSKWHVNCLSLSWPFIFSCSLFLFSFMSAEMVISFATKPSFLCRFLILLYYF